MTDSDPFALMEYLINELNARKISFLEVNEALTFDDSTNAEKKERIYAGKDKKTIREHFKSKFNGVWIANYKFTRDLANADIESGKSDAVSFGQLYV